MEGRLGGRYVAEAEQDRQYHCHSGGVEQVEGQACPLIHPTILGATEPFSSEASTLGTDHQDQPNLEEGQDDDGQGGRAHVGETLAGDADHGAGVEAHAREGDESEEAGPEHHPGGARRGGNQPGRRRTELVRESPINQKARLIPAF